MKVVAMLTCWLLLIPLAGRAPAQTLQVPRVEIGAAGGLVGAIAEGLHARFIGEPRVTVNVSQRDAIELAADMLVPGVDDGVYGLYFLQYRRTMRRPPDWRGLRPFFTAGTGGYFYYRGYPERRTTRLDGSVVVYPAHADGEIGPLRLVAFGGGFEQRLNRQMSFRLEGTGFALLANEGFLGFRVLAGVSFPIGGYGASAVR